MLRTLLSTLHDMGILVLIAILALFGAYIIGRLLGLGIIKSIKDAIEKLKDQKRNREDGD